MESGSCCRSSGRSSPPTCLQTCKRCLTLFWMESSRWLFFSEYCTFPCISYIVKHRLHVCHLFVFEDDGLLAILVEIIEHLPVHRYIVKWARNFDISAVNCPEVVWVNAELPLGHHDGPALDHELHLVILLIVMEDLFILLDQAARPSCLSLWVYFQLTFSWHKQIAPHVLLIKYPRQKVSNFRERKKCCVENVLVLLSHIWGCLCGVGTRITALHFNVSVTTSRYWWSRQFGTKFPQYHHFNVIKCRINLNLQKPKNTNFGHDKRQIINHERVVN